MAVMTDKIVEKKLPPGKRRFHLVESSGYELEAVYLKGMRSRPWPITRVDEKTFHERCPKDEHGHPIRDGIFMHGLPQIFWQHGWMIYLWPAPSNEWTIQFHLRKKVKHDALLPEVRSESPVAAGGSSVPDSG